MLKCTIGGGGAERIFKRVGGGDRVINNSFLGNDGYASDGQPFSNLPFVLKTFIYYLVLNSIAVYQTDVRVVFS